MTERFFEGYHLTRFFYARDETYASYLCNIYETEYPYNNQHYFWLAELIESGFHGDAFIALLRGITMKLVCYGDKSTNTNQWLKQIHNHILDLKNVADMDLDLSVCHNDTEDECVTTTDGVNVYDEYKNAMYSISNYTQHFGSNHICMEQIEEILQLERSNHQPLTRFRGQKRIWFRNYGENYYNLLRKLEECCKKKGDYKKLYYQCYNVMNTVIFRQYDTLSGNRNPLLNNIQDVMLMIEDFATKVLKLSVSSLVPIDIWLELCASLFSSYVTDETDNPITNSYMIDRKMMETMLISIVFIQCSAIVSSFIEKNIDEMDELTTMMSKQKLSSNNHKKMSSNETTTAYHDIADEFEETDFLHIEALRNHEYFTAIEKTGLKDGHRYLCDLLDNRAILPIHEFVQYFNTTQRELDMSIDDCIAVREEEWVHYYIFTPLWRYRLEKEQQGELPYECNEETCEMDVELLENPNKWNLQFTGIQEETKIHTVYSAFQHISKEYACRCVEEEEDVDVDVEEQEQLDTTKNIIMDIDS
jgi:hypothetical protein